MSPRILPLADLAGGARPRGAVVLTVPGEEVSTLTCQVPPNLGGKRAETVALQAVQDLAASPAETSHFAVLPGTGPTRTVAAMAAANRALWSAARTRHRMRGAAVLPDYLCLPWRPGTLTVNAGEGRLMVRSGETTGFAAETGIALKMLALIRTRQAHGVTAICLLPASARDDAALMAELKAWGVPVEACTRPPNPPRASVLGGAGAGLGARGRRYAALLLTGVAALGLWAANTEMDLRRLEAQIAAQRQANLGFVRDELGLTGPIVDLRVQVDRALADLRQAARDEVPPPRFPELLAAVGPALADPQVTVSEMRYAGGALDVSVTLANFATLEQVQDALAGPGVSAEILRSVGSGAEGVTADLRVTRAGAR